LGTGVSVGKIPLSKYVVWRGMGGSADHMELDVAVGRDSGIQMRRFVTVGSGGTGVHTGKGVNVGKGVKVKVG